MMEKNYIKRVGIVALSAAVVISAINFFVDPYLIFESPRISNLNAVKPTAVSRERIFKARHVERKQPRTVIVGNSRGHRGYSPESAAWPSDMQPVYNLSLAGATLYESALLLAHAANNGKVETAIIGIEFHDFLPNTNVQSNPIYLDRNRSLKERVSVSLDGMPNERWWINSLLDQFGALVSFDALLDSIYTIILQQNDDAPDMTNRGLNPLREGRSIIQDRGQHALFTDNYSDIPRDLLRRVSKPADIGPTDFASTEAADTLNDIMSIASRKEISLVFLIHPQHSDYYEMVHSIGLGESYKNWKRYILSAVNKRMQGKVPVIWDFSGYGPYNTETVPYIGDRESIMKWHVEPGHFSVALGGKVIETIFSTKYNSSEPTSFGQQLTEGNLEGFLITQDQLRRNFQQRNTERLSIQRQITGALYDEWADRLDQNILR